MDAERGTIIADVRESFFSRRLPAIVFVVTALVGLLAAWYFARLGLTLSHHDARAHLVVARRITDNITPGWQQVGALWLPLPHLLNLIPIQFDINYRTGLSATLLSVLSMAGGLSAFACFLRRRTTSVAVACTGVALVLSNPNTLYLQSTPMTEPMLFGLSLVALDALDRWLTNDAGVAAPAVALSLLVLVRYEAWPVTLVMLAIAGLVTTRRREWLLICAAPLAAIACFLLLSRASVGEWFVSSGFFVADNAAIGRPLTALGQIVDGFRDVTDDAVIAAAIAGVAWCITQATTRRSFQPLLPVALLATFLVPLGAFSEGHPFRCRYMVPLAVGAAALGAFSIAWLPARIRNAAAVLVVGGSAWLNPPLTLHAPVIVEAQIENPLRAERAAVSAVLAARGERTPILASMQSLGHYMQETSAFGLEVADYLHEGNGDLWSAAITEPKRIVHWILIEERAEGGDVLAKRARTDPRFLDGFTRVAEGGGLALYHLDDVVQILDRETPPIGLR